MIFFLSSELENYFPKNHDGFTQIMKLEGKIFRSLENRKTQLVTINRNNYFVKQHSGIGWKEIFKNLIQGRLPVLGARNEWRAIQRFQKLNIPTTEIVAYGCKGINPAQMHSFLITKALNETISLEDYCHQWAINKPKFQIKMKLINEVARITSIMHQNGINHRDLYICHFLLEWPLLCENDCKLYLIDLHRSQIRKVTPLRWRIKDLAGLYFSSMDIGLTQRDLLRFVKRYTMLPLREALADLNWQVIKKRAERLYKKHGK